MGGVGGVLLASLASRKHELVDALGNSVAASQGDQMLALTIAVVVGRRAPAVPGRTIGSRSSTFPPRLTRVVAVATR